MKLISQTGFGTNGIFTTVFKYVLQTSQEHVWVIYSITLFYYYLNVLQLSEFVGKVIIHV